MLWYSEIEIVQRLKKAAEHYNIKYNKVPNICLVHQSIDTNTFPELNILIKPSKYLFSDKYILIGYAENLENLK